MQIPTRTLAADNDVSRRSSFKVRKIAEKRGCMDAEFKYCTFEDETLYCRIGEKAFVDNVDSFCGDPVPTLAADCCCPFFSAKTISSHESSVL